MSSGLVQVTFAAPYPLASNEGITSRVVFSLKPKRRAQFLKSEGSEIIVGIRKSAVAFELHCQLIVLRNKLMCEDDARVFTIDTTLLVIDG